ncbi:3-phosphoserine/phosphohydroxythreonine transaminase [Sinanaerobacter chloroacetimidivorans]|jgi:phosphoserine aminotransferase|uniref:Phosphoserine aminotransferase n=1 Tax=Sinanaerobacter chloroacetimidivorans TaxID=2818044 RepID=A0A8J7VYK5_9FIRM|nr:3-phosphoserine/phosphohydroxythreonine transaminase [Sinanaerobacter chloroacetimidivorans]MBR0597434.1 3-phosphoserine/phosphohydroxythreonine transaminase [Sinanaerobacter chloroacetimidivorans]
MKKAERVYNFSAGPSMLPLEVMEQAAEQLTNYGGCGMSVMEMSHRSSEFEEILHSAEKNLRDIMNIPDHYKVLFIQGGATLQFSMIPMNLLRNSKKADYIVTGAWAKKAAEEAKKFGDIKIVASSEESVFSYIPEVKKEEFREDADYVHITMNNTIYGTKFPYIPDTGEIPLVADFSSCILSETVDVSKFALIYAGAQKNIGPAGVVIVIIREDLIGHASADIPVYLDYKIHADNESMYNTPPTFGIYMAGEVFKNIVRLGGVPALEKINREKAKKLYDYIDQSALYSCPVVPKDRSLMNVVFVTGNTDLDKKFTKEAKAAGLHNLGGHRSIGGMRASIYNAMPMEGVDTLIEFMKKFEAENK